MQLKVSTPRGTISASYLRSKTGDDGKTVGLHMGLLGQDSVVSLEYGVDGSLSLIVNHDELDVQKIRFVSRVGGWSGHDIY